MWLSVLYVYFGRREQGARCEVLEPAASEQVPDHIQESWGGRGDVAKASQRRIKE